MCLCLPWYGRLCWDKHNSKKAVLEHFLRGRWEHHSKNKVKIYPWTDAKYQKIRKLQLWDWSIVLSVSRNDTHHSLLENLMLLWKTSWAHGMHQKLNAWIFSQQCYEFAEYVTIFKSFHIHYLTGKLPLLVQWPFFYYIILPLSLIIIIINNFMFNVLDEILIVEETYIISGKGMWYKSWSVWSQMFAVHVFLHISTGD